MTWSQHYDPTGNGVVSTLLAAAPVVVLLGAIAWLRIRVHLAAWLGLGVALALALGVYRMPVQPVLGATGYGAAYGLFPIGWIILNLIFLYQLTVRRGLFDVLRGSLASLAPDPRVQVILIAFSFGAFFEGAAGFGTPVAVTSAILISLGFAPLQACGLSLIANTAPVAFGSLGTPIIALNAVTGMDLHQLSAMVGRQLPFFSLIVPFWVVWAMVGWRGMLGVWPAALIAGISFAVPQFLVSNFHGPWLVDVVASVCSMGALAGLLRFWKPKTTWSLPAASSKPAERSVQQYTRRELRRAWLPWATLSLFLFVWGLPQVKGFLNGDSPLGIGSASVRLPSGVTKIDIPVPKLDRVVLRSPPVAPPNAQPERAVFTWNWLSATGTAILLAALVTGLLIGYSPRELLGVYWATLIRVRFSLLTIAGMLALGYVTKYSGADATLGLALAHTGTWYPFFGTLLGWLGVALTGSDTASNVLFGSLQRITAEQTGISPILMGAANSSGGVMGKMIDAQSIVVASTATNWFGHEGEILRYVFFHSLALATLVGVLVYLQAKVPPFVGMVVQ
ncbi:MAG TPA: L-lactate permease [Verrucomicrobiota bacterium]|nr:L-lactate permease [Verrucomicrobiota bacterium]HRZ37284.1 L-lactate permease [Candidatus Paceibacterota bacterium]